LGRVIALANQKGGVGKTTTGINLAASLARTRRRVLLIDLDPQGNATVGSGVPKGGSAGAYEVLLGTSAIEDVVVTTGGGFDVVPADEHLAGAQVELINEAGRDRRLRDAIERIRERYDYILIDCPPSLNVLTVNALVAADSVMIPMQCEYFALEGLTALVDTIRRVRERLNPGLRIEGLLRTMFDPRNSLTAEVSEQLRQHFGDKLFRTVIPRNVRLAEAPSHGRAAIDYDATSKGAQAYLALAGELLNRDSGASAA